MSLTQLNLNREPEDEAPAEKTTVRKFLQLWKVLSVLCLSAATAFGIGYHFRDYLAKMRENEQNTEIQRLREQLNEQRGKNRVASKKHDFFIYANRYRSAKEAVEHSPSNKGAGKELVWAKKDYAAYLDDNVGSDKDQNGEVDLAVVKNDESRDKSMIRFRDEQETYPVPKEVKDMTKFVCWHNKEHRPPTNSNGTSIRMGGRVVSPDASPDMLRLLNGSGGKVLY